MKLRVKNIPFYLVIIIISSYILVQLFFPTSSMIYLGIKPLVVMSSSMDPKIKVNDVVIIKKVEEEDLKIHDIITFEVYLPDLGAKGYVTHYIGNIDTLENGTKIYYTQGATKGPGEYDQWTNENGEKIYITYQDITGKVIFTIPLIGHLILIIKDPVMVFLITLNIIVIYLIFKLVTTKNKTKEPKDRSEINK